MNNEPKPMAQMPAGRARQPEGVLRDACGSFGGGLICDVGAWEESFPFISIMVAFAQLLRIERIYPCPFDVPLIYKKIIRMHGEWKEVPMERKYLDCRDYPSEMKCTIMMSADSETELLEAAVQHAVAVHKEKDTPELRLELHRLIKTMPVAKAA